MRAVRGVYDEMGEECKGFVDEALIDIYDNHSQLLSVELNLSYFIKALSVRHTSRQEEILVELFDQLSSSLIRRQIILIMAAWDCFY